MNKLGDRIKLEIDPCPACKGSGLEDYIVGGVTTKVDDRPAAHRPACQACHGKGLVGIRARKVA